MLRLAFRSVALALGLLVIAAGQANAALTTFQQYTGTVALSSDGFGSLSNSGTISASVPAGLDGPCGLSLYGGLPEPDQHRDSARRSTVRPWVTARPCQKSVVRCLLPVVDGACGRHDDRRPGHRRRPGRHLQLHGDGGELFTGRRSARGRGPEPPVAGRDRRHSRRVLERGRQIRPRSTSSIRSTLLDPGFFAEMILASSFSCCDQRPKSRSTARSSVGTPATTMMVLNIADGSLITVGGFDDPFSPLLPELRRRPRALQPGSLRDRRRHEHQRPHPVTRTRPTTSSWPGSMSPALPASTSRRPPPPASRRPPPPAPFQSLHRWRSSAWVW